MNGCRIEISTDDFLYFINLHKGEDSLYPGCMVKADLPPLEEIKILTPEIPLSKNKKRNFHPRVVITIYHYAQFSNLILYSNVCFSLHSRIFIRNQYGSIGSVKPCPMKQAYKP